MRDTAWRELAAAQAGAGGAEGSGVQGRGGDRQVSASFGAEEVCGRRTEDGVEARPASLHSQRRARSADPRGTGARRARCAGFLVVTDYL